MTAPLDQNENVHASELRAESASGEASSPVATRRSAPGDFEALYEQWFEAVSRWVRALGAREADREDLVQDVFLVVHRRLPDFDGQNVAGWLYQIARRKVRDYRHLMWIKYLFAGSSLAAGEDVLKTSQGPLEALETRQKRELFERLLEGLNPDQRAAFVLFEIEGNSGEDIARLQGVPINTVWARIHKARKKLQERASRFERTDGRAGT